MTRKKKFKKGDKVRLLSVPMTNDPRDDLATNEDGTPLDGIGEVWPIDSVRVWPVGTYYYVAGWVVQERHIERVAS